MDKRSLFPILLASILGTALLLAQRPAAAEPVDVTPLPPVTEADGRLGVAYGFYEDPPDSGQRPYLDLMIDAGARHDRWDFSWWAIQPEGQDQWNWGGHERIVRAENARGVDVLGIFIWTPQWASTYTGPLQALPSPGAPPPPGSAASAHALNPLSPAGPAPYNSFPPRNLDQPVYVDGEINPENYWGYFVYHTAKHFDGQMDPALRVDAWEIWNEVEGDYFWSGSAQDYCRLLQVAYKAIKGEPGATGGNPQATVLFAGLHYWADPAMYTQVLDCLTAADPGGATHNYFFDVMSVHFYSRSDNTYDMVNLIRGEMAARGMVDHPIWLTETGAPMYGDASPGQPVLNKWDYYLSIDEEAAYVLQSYANALAAGVDRYYFFRAHDADMLEPHGLIRNDHSLRPSYVAYQVAARYLQGENQATRVTGPTDTRVSLWGTPLGKISVLWNRTPQPVTYTLPAAMPTATLVDRHGVTQTLIAVNGAYTLPLPVATANRVTDPNDYIVGGDPLLLIETDTVSPTSSLSSLPAINQGLPITLTWTATDTQSGIWYTELQASPSPTGPWSTFAGLAQTQGATQTVYYGQHAETYYFRARARDNVGNWEAWPLSYEVSTTVDADTELHWSVETLFNDSNRNGEWDREPGTGSLQTEITLTQVSMRFVDEDWHTITATVGGSWHFTQTLLPGTYTFVAQWQDASGEDWMRQESLTLDGTLDPLFVHYEALGLLPRFKLYLPLAMSGR